MEEETNLPPTKEPELQNYLFKNTVVPRNRREIRVMLQDRKRFEPLLKTAGDIIERSIQLVNEAETEELRRVKYLNGLNEFNSICDCIANVKKPKYWKLNRHFYTETVKPVV